MDLRDNARSKETNEIFTGSPAFDSRERIWDGIFHAGNSRALLCDVLDLSDRSEDRSTFNKMKNGTRGWDGYARGRFLHLAASEEKDKDNYRTAWLNKLIASPVIRFSEIREVLTDFVEICPDRTWPDVFGQVGNQVRGYLTVINSRTKTLSPDDAICKEYLAAGLYSLVCLFLQNAKSCTPVFRRPAEAWDPVVKYAEPEDDKSGREDNPVVVTLPPEAGLYAPEERELHFDLFSHIKEKLAEQEVAEAESGQQCDVPPVITPSLVRQQPVEITGSFEIAEVPGFDSHAFLIDTQVRVIGNQYQPRLTLRRLYRTTRKAGGMDIRTYQYSQQALLTLTAFEGIIISTEKDGTRCRLHSFTVTKSEKTGRFDSLSMGPCKLKFAVVDIDRDGYLAEQELDELLDFCDVHPEKAGRNVHSLERSAVSGKLDPDYLNYLVLDRRTLQEIPKHPVRDRLTGARQLAITVPCPGQLIVLQMDTGSLRADLLAAGGMMYGLYGCEQSVEDVNEILMKGVWTGDNSLMAFQYGAYLRCKGMPDIAVDYLRTAAAANIPGAVYELAELLTQQGQTEEAGSLIQSLLDKGYRSYGAFPIKLPEA